MHILIRTCNFMQSSTMLLHPQPSRPRPSPFCSFLLVLSPDSLLMLTTTHTHWCAKRWCYEKGGVGGENVSKSEDIILGWSLTLSLIFAKCSIKYTHRNCLYILWWLDLHGWWETDDGGGTTVVAVAVAAAAVEWLWPIKQIINYLSAAAAVTVGRGEFAFSNQLSLHVILSCQRGFIYNPQLQLQAIALRKLSKKNGQIQG